MSYINQLKRSTTQKSQHTRTLYISFLLATVDNWINSLKRPKHWFQTVCIKCRFSFGDSCFLMVGLELWIWVSVLPENVGTVLSSTLTEVPNPQSRVSSGIEGCTWSTWSNYSAMVPELTEKVWTGNCDEGTIEVKNLHEMKRATTIFVYGQTSFKTASKHLWQVSSMKLNGWNIPN